MIKNTYICVTYLLRAAFYICMSSSFFKKTDKHIHILIYLDKLLIFAPANWEVSCAVRGKTITALHLIMNKDAP